MIRHIYCSGMVQGVGFRYKTLQIAEQLGLKGWVCNLSDGRVEIMAQGPSADLDQLVEYLKKHYGSYLRDVQIRNVDTTEEFVTFEIKR